MVQESFSCLCIKRKWYGDQERDDTVKRSIVIERFAAAIRYGVYGVIKTRL
jgi:hypothetical protein